MKLKTVEIYDFKSISYEKLEIQSNQICLVGKNESGKSSIISAISYLNILETELDTSLLNKGSETVSYTHLRAHETEADLVCRLLLEKKKQH